MEANIVAFLKNVKKGKTKNWLTFEINIGRFDVNKQYTVNFCGTDMDSCIPLTDEQEVRLKELLVEDFGYAPYDIEGAKKILGNGKQYVIKK